MRFPTKRNTAPPMARVGRASTSASPALRFGDQQMQKTNPSVRRWRWAGAAILPLTLAATTLIAAPAAQSADKYYNAAVAEAKKIAKSKKLAKSIEMIGVNSGAEGADLEKLYAAFTAGTGVKVKYTGSQDTTAVIQSRVSAGNPPDIADIQLGTAMFYAKKGKLVDLSKAFGSTLKANMSQALLDGSSYNGKVFGVFQGMNNFMLWYNPTVYTGPKNPTWAQIVKYTNDQAAAGKTAWCAAQGAGGGSGFPGAQFIENYFLKKYGPKAYMDWGLGKLAWTSPQVKDAFKQFGAVVAKDKNVDGGVSGMLANSIGTGYNGLTAATPTCQLVLWGAWVPGLIGETAKPGVNIDFFPAPAGNPAYANAELFQATVSVGFTNTPTTKAFLQWLSTTPAQAYLASMGRWPVANKNVTATVYPNASLKKIANAYFANPKLALSVGPNLLAGPATSTAFYKGVMTFVQDQSQLDAVLQSIQATIR